MLDFKPVCIPSEVSGTVYTLKVKYVVRCSAGSGPKLPTSWLRGKIGLNHNSTTEAWSTVAN